MVNVQSGEKEDGTTCPNKEKTIDTTKWTVVDRGN